MDSVVSWFVLTVIALVGAYHMFSAYVKSAQKYEEESEKDWARLEKEWSDAERRKWHE